MEYNFFFFSCLTKNRFFHFAAAIVNRDRESHRLEETTIFKKHCFSPQTYNLVKESDTFLFSFARLTKNGLFHFAAENRADRERLRYLQEHYFFSQTSNLTKGWNTFFFLFLSDQKQIFPLCISLFFRPSD